MFFSYIVVVRVYFKYLMYLKRTSVCFTWFNTNVPLRAKKEKLKVHFICHQKKQNDVFFLVGMFEAEQSVVLYLCYSQFVMIYNLYIFNDEVLMQVSEIKCD